LLGYDAACDPIRVCALRASIRAEGMVIVYDTAEMDADALLAAARADMSPAAEVARLWSSLPTRPRNPLPPLAVLILAFGAAAIILAPPRNLDPINQPILAIVALVVLGGVVLSSSISLLSNETPPDERLLLAVWYLRHALAVGDERLAPYIGPSLEDSNSVESVAGRFRVHWVNNLPGALRYNTVRRWLNPIVLVLFLGLVIALGKQCLPFGSVCQPVGNLQGPVYVIWGPGLMLMNELMKVGWMSIGTAYTDANGVRVLFDRRRRRVIRWEEVRSLTRLRFRNDRTFTPRDLYVLDAGDTVLAWGFNNIVSNIFWRSRNRTEGAQFARAVVARTGIPLRDGSALLRAVADASHGQFSPNWPKQLAPLSGMPPIEPSPQLTAAMDAVTPHPHFDRRDALACAPVAVYIAFCIIGWFAWS